MAHSKPGAVAYVERGKFVSAVRGLTDTFNWIISCFNNFSNTEIKADGLKDGKPKFRVNCGDGLVVDKSKLCVKVKAGSDTNLVASVDDDNSLKIDVYYK